MLDYLTCSLAELAQLAAAVRRRPSDDPVGTGIVASQAAQRLEQETPAIHFWFNEGFSRAALGYLLKDVTERFARTAADKSGVHCIELFAGPVQRVLDSGSACRSRPEAQGSIRPGYQQQAINVEDLERPLARRVRLSAGSARLLAAPNDNHASRYLP